MSALLHRSSRFLFARLLCAVSSIFLVTLSVAGCGGTGSTTNNLTFWEPGIITVGLLSAPGPVSATISDVQDALNSTLATQPNKYQVTALESNNIPPLIIQAKGKTAAAFFQLNNSGNAPTDADLKTAIDFLNSKAPIAVSGTSTSIGAASPDWIFTNVSTGGGFVGGSPNGKPTSAPNGTKSTTSFDSNVGTGMQVYVFDTTEPTDIAGPFSQGTRYPHKNKVEAVDSSLCPSTATSTTPWSSSSCPTLVSDLSGKVIATDTAALPDESTYMQFYGADFSFRDHGLFGSEIIHHRAPAAQVHLVRVLNDYGVGDLRVLTNALSTVPNGAVVNLSLSMQPPLNCMIGVWRDGYIQYASDGHLDPSACFKDPHIPVTTSDTTDPQAKLKDTLGFTIADMVNQGYTIVAAAGNDSAGSRGASSRLDADLPAAICGVYAVAAASSAPNPDTGAYDGGRLADFSNYPFIARNGDPNKPDCYRYSTLNSNATQYSVQALGVDLCSLYVYDPTSNGYGIWSGTSFAASMISGNIAANGGTFPSVLKEDQPCKP